MTKHIQTVKGHREGRQSASCGGHGHMMEHIHPVEGQRAQKVISKQQSWPHDREHTSCQKVWEGSQQVAVDVTVAARRSTYKLSKVRECREEVSERRRSWPHSTYQSVERQRVQGDSEQVSAVTAT